MSKIEPHLKGKTLPRRPWETHPQSQIWETALNSKWPSLTIHWGPCAWGHGRGRDPCNHRTTLSHRGSPGWFQQLRNSRPSEGRSPGFLGDQALESADRKRQHTEEIHPGLRHTPGSFPRHPLSQMCGPCDMVDSCSLLEVLDSDSGRSQRAPLSVWRPGRVCQRAKNSCCIFSTDACSPQLPTLGPAAISISCVVYSDSTPTPSAATPQPYLRSPTHVEDEAKYHFTAHLSAHEANESCVTSKVCY